IDPEDVITAFTCYDRATGNLGQLSFDVSNRQHCSNGDAVLAVDNDGNGYPHDISGWDFYDHQNDPATYDSGYGHANGQQKPASRPASPTRRPPPTELARATRPGGRTTCSPSPPRAARPRSRRRP